MFFFVVALHKSGSKQYNLSDAEPDDTYEDTNEDISKKSSSPEDEVNNAHDSDSEDSNYYYEAKSETDRMLNKDDLINQIINGQKDHVELRPLKFLNVQDDSATNSRHHHPFAIDLIVCGNDLCVTVDISNQINVWSLNSSIHTNATSDLVLTILMDNITRNNNSVWSMTLTSDDRYLFVGQSSGQLTAFDLCSKDKTNLFFRHASDDTRIG